MTRKAVWVHAGHILMATWSLSLGQGQDSGVAASSGPRCLGPLDQNILCSVKGLREARGLPCLGTQPVQSAPGGQPRIVSPKAALPTF